MPEPFSVKIQDRLRYYFPYYNQTSYDKEVGLLLRGLYALVVSVKRPIIMEIKSLGRVNLKVGRYVYVGSGMGVASTSIEGRLNRHFRGSKKKYWHIDRLLNISYAKPVSAIFSEARLSHECSLAKEISTDPKARIAYRRFGASDCSCDGHLIFFGNLRRIVVEQLVWQKFEDLNFKPQRWNI